MRTRLSRMSSWVGIVVFTLAGMPVRKASAAGAISLTAVGIPYTQNFDTLASTGTTNTMALVGWDIQEGGGGSRDNELYAAGTGSENTGDVYSFGSSSSTERAYGTLRSGTLVPVIGAQFTNNTGSTVTRLEVSYTGEMWRAGVTNRGAADRLDFQLSTDATGLLTGTWVDYDTLDFNSPNLNATAGALDSNSPANRTSISYTISGLSIPNGSSFWIRWTDFEITSSEDGLAVDDFSLTPQMAGSVCDTAFTPIYAIQGSGLSAAITGTVTTQGVVVGDFEGNAGLQGFYLQDPTGDGNPATSDGIFVFTGNSDLVSAGQLVRVIGYARERFNETTLNGSNSDISAVSAANIVDCGSGSVTPTEVTMPFAVADYPERFEGMLVHLPQTLVISEHFDYGRFGEIVLALPINGETRPFTGTAIDAPGAPALARELANSLRHITLDDGLGIQNPASLRHPNGNVFSLNNRFRGGDTVANTVGVLGYGSGVYRIQPTGPADYVSVNARPAAPEDVGGNLRVAAMNTFNFFITQDYPTGDPLDNKCGPLQNVECRGGDADQQEEFKRQRDKLLAALAGVNADIVGLSELENTTGVDPLGDPTNGIVQGLNSTLGAGTYAYIDTGVIGTDAIRVGLVYRPGKVGPVGAFKVLDSTVDPRFIDYKSRPVLAQTFEILDTGARFTVAVSHLKSKGSDCNDVGDPDTGDGQGNCNLTRKAAAQALVDWLATDPTGSGDPDFLIIGELSSYAKEDPIDAIRAGSDDLAGTDDDYTDVIARDQGTYAYSYLFDGQFGYLDHALASSSLASSVTGAAHWHINADEPGLLDYDTTFKPSAQDALYEPDAYRSSDHDPVVIGLNLLYSFNGFFQPIDNLPTLNVVKAGSGVPVKFSLNGDQGLNIFAAGYPKSQQVACNSSSVDAVEETVTAGSSSLSYDPAADQYTYVWKTNRAWAGTCRQLVIQLTDGSFHSAAFRFK